MTNNQSRLKQILSSNQMTHKTVAILLDVSLSAVDKWSSGERNMPTGKLKYLELLIKQQKVKQ